ncbi:hypothetical protein [Aestuariirhabdus litorea]|uniref:Uncharacterized protein n=1 Tax=Aestuariirhabdus litorea TaxID=2528527 RepID=A0A3P3VPY2_9GAMM|nr:hypothetical protein [Aestuariirhabdus litorea]RRJ83649.1 hypothetical protein D0544_00550 [Aestuariirhabdus litorea]RWW96871.1 hypothetical protein DZC74_00550 [Endozoicomonadaceae bacterium GTF-13]
MGGWQKVHLWVGAMGVLLFLVSGAYMNSNFPDLYGGNMMVRMMYRANHVYLLLGSLVNLGLAMVTLAPLLGAWRWVRGGASLLLVVGNLLLLFAFWWEPAAQRIDRPLTFWGLILLMAGTGALLLAWFKRDAETG